MCNLSEGVKTPNFDDFSGREKRSALYLFVILIVVHNGKSVMASGPHQGSPAYCELSEHIRHISIDTLDFRLCTLHLSSHIIPFLFFVSQLNTSSSSISSTSHCHHVTNSEMRRVMWSEAPVKQYNSPQSQREMSWGWLSNKKGWWSESDQS